MKKYILLILLFWFTSQSQNTTWSNGVGKIIYENCAACHKPGGIAPFSLTSFEDAVANAQSISYAVSNGIMPPWTPDPNYRSFAHQRVISTEDKNAVLQWIANNTPSGDLHQAPKPHLPSSTSQLGTPDLSLTIPTFTVNSNQDVYHNFELSSGLSTINYAKAIEVIPGNPAIVHHVLVFEDSSTNPINPTSVGGTGSSSSKLLFGYTPGSQPYFAPVGTGLKLNANTRIIVQVHYAPNNLGATDATTINFKLATTPQREIQVAPLLNHTTTLINGPLSIPADQTRTFNEQFTVPIDATLLYVFPHMHRVGKSIESFATTTGANIPFVKIPNWEFHWQDNFVFPNTVKVRAGNILKAVAFYDNTTNNPDNPNSPPQNVSLGENTSDEMMLVFFAYLPYQSGDENLIVDKRIIPATSTTFCQGQSVKLKAIEGIGYTYQWFMNGTAIPNAIASNYEASTAGNYNTVSITLGSNNAISDPITVTIQTLPIATITTPGTTIIPVGGSLTLTAPSDASYTYQWYKDGIALNGENNATLVANQAGDYTVEIYNGCYATSAITTLTTALVTTTFNSAKITIYPNPSKGSFIIKNGNQYNLSVYNNLGQLIQKENVTSNEFNTSIQGNGFYLLELTNERGNRIIEKLIVK